MNEQKNTQSGALSLILKFDKIVTFISTNVAVVCYALMIILILYGIILRFVLRIPNLYGEELSLFLMFVSVSFGIAQGIRSRSHLGVEMFVSKMPDKAEKVIRAFATLISLIAFILLAYVTFRFFCKSLAAGSKTSAIQMPYYAIYFILFVDFVLCSLQQLLIFWNDYILSEKILPEKGSGIIE